MAGYAAFFHSSVLQFPTLQPDQPHVRLDLENNPSGVRCFITAAKGALQTVAGYEAMHAIRKGQIRWLPKGDVVGQVQFIQRILGSLA
jgi:hypothetical protein